VPYIGYKRRRSLNLFYAKYPSSKCVALPLLHARSCCFCPDVIQCAGTGCVQKFAQLGHCKLESDAVIEDCVIGYRTFGTLNAARDNAVLMPTWLYGTTADLTQLFGNPHNTTPASRAMILVDTSKYFGIAIDSFGDGVSSSPSNSKTQHGTAFPCLF
jgi:homoserine O-acetyltransferase